MLILKVLCTILIVLLSNVVYSAPRIYIDIPPITQLKDLSRQPSDTIKVIKYNPLALSVFVSAEDYEGQEVEVYAYRTTEIGFEYLSAEQWNTAKSKTEFKPAITGVLPAWIWNSSWIVYESLDSRSFDLYVCVDIYVDGVYSMNSYCAVKHIEVSIW